MQWNQMGTVFTVLALGSAVGCAATEAEDVDVRSSVLLQEGDAPVDPMAAWIAAGTPGEPHKKLGTLKGRWNVKSTMWMQPGMPPMESTAKAEYKAVFEGRFVNHTFEGTMMGMPFNGQGTWGYDNVKKKYFNSWVDSFGTMMMLSEGTADKEGKVLTLEATYPDPVSKKDKTNRQVLTFVSEDEHKLEMYDVAADGSTSKAFVMIYTRIK
jgi:hypothetical protein